MWNETGIRTVGFVLSLGALVAIFGVGLTAKVLGLWFLFTVIVEILVVFGIPKSTDKTGECCA